MAFQHLIQATLFGTAMTFAVLGHTGWFDSTENQNSAPQRQYQGTWFDSYKPATLIRYKHVGGGNYHCTYRYSYANSNVTNTWEIRGGCPRKAYYDTQGRQLVWQN